MKRFKFILLIFIIVFPLNFSFVYASNSNGDNSDNEDNSINFSGWDSWSLGDKIRFYTTHIGYIAQGVSNFVVPNGMDYGEACEKLFLDKYLANGYSSYGEMLADKTSYDSASDSLVFDDLALQFLNDLASLIKDDSTYQYGYFPTNAYLSASSFASKNTYETISRLISLYPDKVFRIQSSSIPGLDTEKGSLNGVSWSWASGWKLTVYDVPYGAVGSPANISSSTPTSVNCYTEDWLLDFSTAFEVYVVDWSGQSFLCFWDKEGNYHEILDYKSLSSGCIDDAYAVPIWASNINKKLNSVLAFSPAYFSQSNLPPMNLYCFSNYSGGIPVFNSLADLKDGTTGKNPLQTLPGYTGQSITKNTISQQEINDFSTNYNYYYGDNSGDNPGGGGSGSGSDSSGGNWLESLLSSLGKLGDIIMTLLSKVFDIITDILKFFTDTLADVMDIIPEGFIGFLGAFFPFIPKEWLTAVSLLLALTLIGAIIKFFKK